VSTAGQKPQREPVTEMIERIDSAVKEAVKILELAEVPCAFDGESWVWLWREMEEDDALKPVPEALLRARPDVFGEGVEIEISGGAWMPQKREIAAGRVYFAQYFEALPQGNELSSQLGNQISRAWKGAQETARRLPEIERRRNETVDKLRTTGVLASHQE
jgi:hypothetical protein